ncbi:MAG: hypothetical protein ABFS39_11665 [Pseudomonadota bacterium]
MEKQAVHCEQAGKRPWQAHIQHVMGIENEPLETGAADEICIPVLRDMNPLELQQRMD